MLATELTHGNMGRIWDSSHLVAAVHHQVETKGGGNTTPTLSHFCPIFVIRQ